MFEKSKESSVVFGQEIDKEIGNLAEVLEQTLIDTRECENDLAQLRQEAEDWETSLLQLIDLSIEVDDKVEIQRYKKELVDMKKQHQALISEMEEILVSFKSVYTSQLGAFEKLKALRRELDYGASGTAH